MAGKLRAFVKDESGATAIEYSLIAAGIAMAIVAVR
jgi:Flp pilus assembly pilin Flp